MCNAFVYSAICWSRLLTSNLYPLLPLLLNETWEALILYSRLDYLFGSSENRTCENDSQNKAEKGCQSGSGTIHTEPTAQARNCSSGHLFFAGWGVR
jgi:hypothetical protein